MPKCESLVKARWVVDEETKLRRIVRVNPPEQCGEECITYEIRSKKRAAKRGNDEKQAQMRFMGVSAWFIQDGTIVVRQALCDKHRKKAEREGKRTIPA